MSNSELVLKPGGIKYFAKQLRDSLFLILVGRFVSNKVSDYLYTQYALSEIKVNLKFNAHGKATLELPEPLDLLEHYVGESLELEQRVTLLNLQKLDLKLRELVLDEKLNFMRDQRFESKDYFRCVQDRVESCFLEDSDFWDKRACIILDCLTKQDSEGKEQSSKVFSPLLKSMSPDDWKQIFEGDLSDQVCESLFIEACALTSKEMLAVGQAFLEKMDLPQMPIEEIEEFLGLEQKNTHEAMFKLSKLQKQILAKLWKKESEKKSSLSVDEYLNWLAEWNPMTWFEETTASGSVAYSRALQRLENRGLVVRVNKADEPLLNEIRSSRRTAYVKLTRLGRKISKRIILTLDS